VVLLYLYAGDVGQSVSALLVTTLALLSFAPVHVAHPFRVRDYGPALPIISVAWAAATVGLLLVPDHRDVRLALLALSSSLAALIILLGLLRTFRGPAHKEKGR